MPRLSLPDAEIHYEVVGSGSPVLMLRPQSRGPVGPGPFIDSLAARHSVVLYDQRGSGLSSPASGPMSMAAQAADALALIDALGLDRVHLFCHSTGCGIGVSLVSTRADRVGSLVLVNPWTHADAHLSVMQNLRIAAARALAPEPYAQFNSALLFPPEFRRAHADGFAQMAARAEQSPHDAGEIEARLNAILAFDARGIFARITTPTLLVTSRDDQLMPAWFAHEAARQIEASRLVELDGGGHMLPETRPAELLEAVHAHLEKADDESRGPGGL